MTAFFALLRRDLVVAGRHGLMLLMATLTQPILVDPYRINRATGSFILIDEVSNQTMAAGMIE